MRILKKLLYIALITGTIQSPLHAMHYANLRALYYIKRAWSALGTFAHYALACQMIKKGFDFHHDRIHIDEINEQTTVEAPEEIRDFVHKILAREEVENVDKVKVRIEKDENTKYNFAVVPRTVFINPKVAKLLQMHMEGLHNGKSLVTTEKSLEYPIQVTWTSPEYITCAKATLTHEAVHLNNNDPFIREISHFTIPITTLLLTRYKLFHNIMKRGMISKIASGAGLNEINNLLYYAICRYQEQRADNAVVRKDEILMTMKEYNFLDAIAPKKSIYQRLHDEYPTTRTRVKRFAERLEELDKIVEE